LITQTRARLAASNYKIFQKRYNVVFKKEIQNIKIGKKIKLTEIYAKK
jgi:hypothetical protein